MYFLDAQCRSMIVRQSPNYSPELSHRALLTSNRKEKKEKKITKIFNARLFFTHFFINLLNSLRLFRDCSYSKRTSLCDKKDLF